MDHEKLAQVAAAVWAMADHIHRSLASSPVPMEAMLRRELKGWARDIDDTAAFLDDLLDIVGEQSKAWHALTPQERSGRAAEHMIAALVSTMVERQNESPPSVH